MDRQTLLFKYYASLAGFQETQSIYWYYISNFPKATDLSKIIDKNAGAEREVVGKNQYASRRPQKEYYHEQEWGATLGGSDTAIITAPATDLAKKYNGYKYSISPLKQTCETIMVFKKPSKTGSILHDTLAMENGDDTITCGALNIDGNRVSTKDDLARENKKDNGMFGVGNNNNNTAQIMKEKGIEYGVVIQPKHLLMTKLQKCLIDKVE
jgi:site-specific DNA-methyltransferase (adenine-specific)